MTRIEAEQTEQHPFDVDTDVDPVSDGRFVAELSDRWNALGGVVNGGYYVAVGLQALRRVLDHRDPLVVSTFFSRPARPGAVEIHTEVARQGRRVSTGEARILQRGKELVRLTATFADLAVAEGDLSLTEPPQLPPPDDAIDPVGVRSFPGVTMTDQVEYRFASVPGWRTGQPSGDPSAEFWMRFKHRREADTLSLPMLVDAAAPVVLDLAGVTGSVTLEMTTHVRRRPAPGWLACRVATRHLAGGYHEEDFDIWDSTGALVTQSRQLALLL
jgi:acyl-CoA thioesterase